jgi:hypothetical protein
LAAGDRVNWRAVDRAEFERLEAVALHGEFVRESLLIKEAQR